MQSVRGIEISSRIRDLRAAFCATPAVHRSHSRGRRHVARRAPSLLLRALDADVRGTRAPATTAWALGPPLRRGSACRSRLRRRGYHGRMRPPPSLPLLRSVLGPAFDRLPAVLRALHSQGSGTWTGEVLVRSGSNLLSRLCAWVAGLPPRCEGRIQVGIEASADGETWTRRFPAHVMRSSLFLDRGRLGEWLGPMRFRYRLEPEGGRLLWSVERAWLLFLPLPRALFRGVVASESVDDGRYTFDVAAALPVIGLLVHYRGWLDVR